MRRVCHPQKGGPQGKRGCSGRVSPGQGTTVAIHRFTRSDYSLMAGRSQAARPSSPIFFSSRTDLSSTRVEGQGDRAESNKSPTRAPTSTAMRLGSAGAYESERDDGRKVEDRHHDGIRKLLQQLSESQPQLIQRSKQSWPDEAGDEERGGENCHPCSNRPTSSERSQRHHTPEGAEQKAKQAIGRATWVVAVPQALGEIGVAQRLHRGCFASTNGC